MITKPQGKILIVDDDPDLQSIYGEVLREAGYKVEGVSDGEDGLSKIIQGGYDLVLLDIMLPKIDGLTILKKVNSESPDRYNGPIIVLSALNNPEVIKTALNNGAKGFIVKSSVTPDQILNKVVEILKTPQN
jgi:DNA-binding response OmpR family regulator